jgi:hypothetical protein
MAAVMFVTYTYDAAVLFPRLSEVPTSQIVQTTPGHRSATSGAASTSGGSLLCGWHVLATTTPLLTPVAYLVLSVGLHLLHWAGSASILRLCGLQPRPALTAAATYILKEQLHQRMLSSMRFPVLASCLHRALFELCTHLLLHSCCCCYCCCCLLLSLLLLLQVMDKHLGLLCRQHLETKFIKVRSSAWVRSCAWVACFQADSARVCKTCTVQLSSSSSTAAAASEQPLNGSGFMKKHLQQPAGCNCKAAAASSSVHCEYTVVSHQQPLRVDVHAMSPHLMHSHVAHSRAMLRADQR